jgi:hypothetical protein
MSAASESTLPRWPLALVALLLAAAVVALLVYGPIRQDQAYHAFADRETLLGVPHFWNVVSNLPFVFAGLAGLYALARGPTPGVLPELRAPYATFFAGAVLIGLGSGWYHLAPNDATLVWDRLPMTISFAAYTMIVVGEHVDPGFARRWLWPAVAVGAASVGWWAFSGDLRPYALVQFGPLVLLPLLLWKVPSRLTATGWHWLVLASYVLAKLCELSDHALHDLIGFSGHPLKHVAAAAGVAALVVAMRVRAPRP